MILYSVTIQIAHAAETEWLDWMRSVHIPAVLATGCFLRCRMYKSITTDPAADPTYVLQYDCRSLEEYERYRDEFAPALQREHSERYTGKFRGERNLMQEILY